MSIKNIGVGDGLSQEIAANPTKFSVEQLKKLQGIVPGYVLYPAIEFVVQQQKRMQLAQSLRQPPVEKQPSVVSQIMQEAQATQGVDALRSNLPEDYAHGGIVAFDDGGDVQAEMDREEYANLLRKLKAASMDIATLPGRAVLGAAEYGISRPLRALGVNVPYLPKEVYGGDPRSVTPYYDALRRQEAEKAEAAAGPTMFPTDERVAAETVKSVMPDIGGIGAPKPAGGIAGLTGAGRAPMKMQLPPGPSYADIAKQSFGEYETKAAAGEKEAQDKIAAERAKITGKAYEGLEASLRKEAEQFGADKDQARNMAIFKAGLAMMAGTSRHAFENIGKGALVGAEDYQKAAADIKKAQKENERMMAQIEQARRAEAIGDRDKMISSIEAFRDRNDARIKYIASGIANATGMDKKEAFEVAKTEFSAEKALEGHRIQAGATLGAAQIRSDAAVEAALARIEGRGEITPQLRMAAMKMIDPNEVEAKAIKSLGWDKKPKDAPKLAILEREKAKLYDAELNEILRRAGAGQPMGGQVAAPDYSGFKTLSVQGP